MSQTLPRFDRLLLRTVQYAVPMPDRADWLRAWNSELWHLHHDRRSGGKPTATLALGLTRDALWLRTEAAKRALEGTATLCLATLASACLLSALVALLLTGSYREFAAELAAPGRRFLLEAVLVVFVTFATISRRHVHQASGTLPRLRRQIFFLLKSALVLLLAFLISADLCQPLYAEFLPAFDLGQILSAAILSITGLRWAFHDQEARCKHCLLALKSPERIGRPSHNLLEWNGTEQVCRDGHGRLNLPEMETSWCRSGQWLDPHQPA
jgi:hypothetical protein